MFVKASHLVLAMTLALSCATNGLARFHSHSRQNDALERRGYEILEAYQHAARGLGAFDDDEELSARDYLSEAPEYERREEMVSDLAERYRNVLDKRSPFIDTHGYRHAWRDQQPLEKRADSDFPHDKKTFEGIQRTLKRNVAEKKVKAEKRARAKAKRAKAEEREKAKRAKGGRKAKAAARLEPEAREAALERVRRREAVLSRRALEDLIVEARALAEEEEFQARQLAEEERLAAREYEEDFEARTLELNENGELFTRDLDSELELASRELWEGDDLDIRDEDIEALVQQARDYLDQEEELEARELVDEFHAREFMENLINEARELANEEELAARDLEHDVEGLVARAVSDEDEDILGRDFLFEEELDVRQLEDLLVQARELVVEEELSAREPSTEEPFPEAREVPTTSDNSKREVDSAHENLEAREPEPVPANAETPVAREVEQPVEAREPSPALDEPAPVEARAPEVGDILAERAPEAEVPAPPLDARAEEPAAATN